MDTTERPAPAGKWVSARILAQMRNSSNNNIDSSPSISANTTGEAATAPAAAAPTTAATTATSPSAGSAAAAYNSPGGTAANASGESPTTVTPTTRPLPPQPRSSTAAALFPSAASSTPSTATHTYAAALMIGAKGGSNAQATTSAVSHANVPAAAAVAAAAVAAPVPVAPTPVAAGPIASPNTNSTHSRSTFGNSPVAPQALGAPEELTSRGGLAALGSDSRTGGSLHSMNNNNNNSSNSYNNSHHHHTGSNSFHSHTNSGNNGGRFPVSMAAGGGGAGGGGVSGGGGGAAAVPGPALGGSRRHFPRPHTEGNEVCPPQPRSVQLAAAGAGAMGGAASVGGGRLPLSPALGPLGGGASAAAAAAAHRVGAGGGHNGPSSVSSTGNSYVPAPRHGTLLNQNNNNTHTHNDNNNNNTVTAAAVKDSPELRSSSSFDYMMGSSGTGIANRWAQLGNVPAALAVQASVVPSTTTAATATANANSSGPAAVAEASKRQPATPPIGSTTTTALRSVAAVGLSINNRNSNTINNSNNHISNTSGVFGRGELDSFGGASALSGNSPFGDALGLSCSTGNIHSVSLNINSNSNNNAMGKPATTTMTTGANGFSLRHDGTGHSPILPPASTITRALTGSPEENNTIHNHNTSNSAASAAAATAAAIALNQQQQQQLLDETQNVASSGDFASMLQMISAALGGAGGDGLPDFSASPNPPPPPSPSQPPPHPLGGLPHTFDPQQSRDISPMNPMALLAQLDGSANNMQSIYNNSNGNNNIHSDLMSCLTGGGNTNTNSIHSISNNATGARNLTVDDFLALLTNVNHSSNTGNNNNNNPISVSANSGSGGGDMLYGGGGTGREPALGNVFLPPPQQPLPSQQQQHQHRPFPGVALDGFLDFADDFRTDFTTSPAAQGTTTTTTTINTATTAATVASNTTTAQSLMAATLFSQLTGADSMLADPTRSNAQHNNNNAGPTKSSGFTLDQMSSGGGGGFGMGLTAPQQQQQQQPPPREQMVNGILRDLFSELTLPPDQPSTLTSKLGGDGIADSTQRHNHSQQHQHQHQHQHQDPASEGRAWPSISHLTMTPPSNSSGAAAHPTINTNFLPSNSGFGSFDSRPTTMSEALLGNAQIGSNNNNNTNSNINNIMNSGPWRQMSSPGIGNASSSTPTLVPVPRHELSVSLNSSSTPTLAAVATAAATAATGGGVGVSLERSPMIPAPASAQSTTTPLTDASTPHTANTGHGGSQPLTPAGGIRPHRASLEAPNVTRTAMACVFRETPQSQRHRDQALLNRERATALHKALNWPPRTEGDVDRLLKSRNANKLLRHLTIVSFSRQHLKGVQELFDAWARNGIPAPDMGFGAYYFYVKEKSDKLLCMKHNGRGATPGHGYGKCDFESRRPNSTCRYEHVCLFCRSKEHGWFEEGRCEGYQQLLAEVEELGVVEADVEVMLNAMEEKSPAWGH